jgi:hypothetical protein
MDPQPDSHGDPHQYTHADAHMDAQPYGHGDCDPTVNGLSAIAGRDDHDARR